METLFVVALAVLLAGVVLAWIAGSVLRSALAVPLGFASAMLGCVLLLPVAVAGAVRGSPLDSLTTWSLPLAAWHVHIDALDALMIGLVALLAPAINLAALRSLSYRAQGLLNLLIVALVLVLAARNAVLFLIGWELMAVASFLLLLKAADTEEAQRGAWTYLIATHLGTAFLLAMLPMLWTGGALGIDQPLDFALADKVGAAKANILFLLAIAGFGTKAALAPFHAWVARTYRTAPAWVAAFSSALMAKVSLYVMFRTILQLAEHHAPPAWWGWTLIGLGLVSGILGMGGALGATRLKVILGYSSIENVGIICMGFGLGLLGVTDNQPTLAVLGFAGALFHFLNHSILKAMMLLATGVVERAAGTDDLAQLGGLLKRLPAIGWVFGLGCVALSALPPLNAFASEWLIYLGFFEGAVGLAGFDKIVVIAAAAGLALIGGLAAACFCGVFGLGFLGVGRSPGAEEAHESPDQAQGRAVTVVLAGVAAFLGIVPWLGVSLVRGPAVSLVTDLGMQVDVQALNGAFASVPYLTLLAFLLLGSIAGLIWARDRQLAAQGEGRSMTWDCGFAYTKPFPRGQYTPASFVDPFVPMLNLLTVRTTRERPIEGYFPAGGEVVIEAEDLAEKRLYGPVFAAFAWVMDRFRWMQAGSVQLYLSFQFAALVIMLLWLVIL